MSYILEALTRSQKPRQRAAIPTLTTGYLVEERTRASYRTWQWTSIGLASMAVAVALYTISGRPLEPVSQSGEPPVQASRPSFAQPPAITEQSVYRSSAEVLTTGASLSSLHPERHALERDAKGIGSVRARAVVSPTALQAGGEASTETGALPGQLPGKIPEHHLKPESRRLVDELLALRREAEHAAPRAQAPSDPPRDMSAARAVDANRRPAHSASSSSQSAPTRSTDALPTLKELPLEMQAALPSLEINVHAYAKSRDQRMVIMNMNTYGEGDRLREGPVIDAITPTGVVLVFNGQRFKLAAR